MKPLVSIVISSHNHGRYLAAAIESALGQTYPRVELIVVDDGSTDDSPEIVRSYGGALTAVFQHNGGQAAAWNTGALIARGAWVIFLDSDDRLLAHAAEVVIDAAAGQPTKIHWRMRLIGEYGQSLGVEIPDGPLPHGDRMDELREFGFDRGPNLASSGNAWCAGFLRKVLPLPEAPLRLSADTMLLGLSPLFGQTAAVERVCTEYRCHPGNNGAKGSVRTRAADVVRRTKLVFDQVGQQLAERGIDVDPHRWALTNPEFVRHRRLAKGADCA